MNPDEFANELFGGTALGAGFGQDFSEAFNIVSSAPPVPSGPSALREYGPTFLQAGSSVLGGIGGYMQGQETAGADEYNASLALMQGKFEEDQLGKEEGNVLSAQKAIYAKAGVEMSGSVLDTALNTATNYEYSKQIAQFNAQSAANMYDYEAKVAKQQGQFKLGAGLLEGAGTLALAFL